MTCFLDQIQEAEEMLWSAVISLTCAKRGVRVSDLLQGSIMSREMELLMLILQDNALQAPRANQIAKALESNLDWARFNELVIYHGVCSYVQAQLELGFTALFESRKEEFQLLNEETAVVQRKSMMLLAELFRIQKALNQAQIPFALMKGPALALSFYQSYKLRGFRDIDLLIRTEDIAAVFRLLEDLSYESNLSPTLRSCMGSAYKRVFHFLVDDWFHEADFSGPNSMAIIDLHWRPIPGLDTDKVLQYFSQIAVAKHQVSTLTAEAHFVIVCLHAAKHRWQRLVWFLDISMMVRSSQIDWQEVSRIAANWGVSNIVAASMRLVQQVLEVAMPEVPEFSKALNKSTESQMQEDLLNILRETPVQFGLFHQIYRNLRLANSKPKACLQMFRQAMRPEVWNFSYCPLPLKLYCLYYILGPTLYFARWVKCSLKL